MSSEFVGGKKANITIHGSGMHKTAHCVST